MKDEVIMQSLYDFTYEQLETMLVENGFKKFNASQLFDWLYQKHVIDIDAMSNLSKPLRQFLKEHFVVNKLSVVQEQLSKDGTRKYLSQLPDGELIETVLMQYDYGHSICVTSQVGCNMGCRFCASGQRKKVRDLKTSEIVEQIEMIQRLVLEENIRVSHIVVMGIGEPFDNYDHVMDMIRIVNHAKGLAIGARHITVSTCGLVPRILDYAKEPFQTNLAISLHASDDELRKKIMPIANRYSLEELMDAVDQYIAMTNRRVTFEYILLENENDQPKDALKLAHLIRGKNVYVNLIPFNHVDEAGFLKSNKAQVLKFYDTLKRVGINVTIRKEHGDDIDAACGQLRSKYKG